MTKYPDLKAYIDSHYIPERTDAICCSAVSAIDGRMFGGMAFMEPCMKPVARMAEAPLEKTTSEKKSAPRSKPRFFVGKTSSQQASECVPFAKPCVEKHAEKEKLEDYDDAGYDALLEELKEKLDERQKHLADSFSDYLLHLIESKSLNNVDVYKAATVDKKLFAKIKNDPEYHPQKLTCLCLCIGVRCNLDEAKDLLARAGYAFSPSDMRDVIFQYFIEKEIYDIVEIDLQLEEYGVPGIIA